MKEIKLLLIEDNDSDTFLIKEILGSDSNQYTFVECSSLSEFEDINLEDIDLVVLDLNLPDSRGIDTFLAVRARCNNVPIVVLTGVFDRSLAMTAMKHGAVDFLMKEALLSVEDYLTSSLSNAMLRFNGLKKLDTLAGDTGNITKLMNNG